MGYEALKLMLDGQREMLRMLRIEGADEVTLAEQESMVELLEKEVHDLNPYED